MKIIRILCIACTVMSISDVDTTRRPDKLLVLEYCFSAVVCLSKVHQTNSLARGFGLFGGYIEFNVK